MSEEITIQTSNLPESSMSSLGIIQNEREALINAYDDVITLEINDENIKTFKELRLKIRDNRTKGIEPWHTTNKAVSLAIGRTIDAIKNREVEVNKRMEEKLLGAEKHFENLEKERTEKLNAERIELVRPYLEDVEHLVLHDMDNDMFEAYLTIKKRDYNAIQEAIKKEEAERLEKIEVEKKRLKAIEVENAKLKKEAEEKEALRVAENKKRLDKEKAEAVEHAKIEAKKQAELDKEKAKQDAILKKEREEKAKLEAELKAKQDAENKAKELKAKEDLRLKKEAEELAKAPVKDKMTDWIDKCLFKGIETSEMNEEQIKLSNDIFSKFEGFKKWAKSEIEKL